MVKTRKIKPVWRYHTDMVPDMPENMYREKLDAVTMTQNAPR
jgi:hypothetical protein